MRKTKMIAFSGASGSGKTTLICRLTSLYAALGRRTVFLKHTHHADVAAGEGDSARVLRSGAVEAVVFGSWGSVRESDASRHSAATLDEVLGLVDDFDLVLIEGLRTHRGIPRVAVIRGDADPLIATDVCAVVSDAPHEGLPFFRFSDLAGLAMFLDTIAAP